MPRTRAGLAAPVVLGLALLMAANGAVTALISQPHIGARGASDDPMVQGETRESTSAATTPSPNPIRVDQAEIPDSLDPAVTFSTPGWAAVQQVYQGLANYNGSSATTFSGILAKNWTVSYDPATGFESYVFNLRADIQFSNGDPYNAYVQWYSLYRSLLLLQGPQFILEENFYSTNFSTTDPLSYYSPAASSEAANASLATDLNSWNFDSPTGSEIALMEIPEQSFEVINSSAIALNLGHGYLDSNYTYLLAAISAPNSDAVDPVWVDAHGDVTIGLVNAYVSANTMGTGPFLLEEYDGVGGGGYTLAPNPHYWGASAAQSEPWNVDLQAANTTFYVTFQDAIDITENALINGSVQEASFAYLGPSSIEQFEGHPNLGVRPLPTIFGATSGSWWIYLNSTVYPFNNLSVREAITHAINYPQIIQVAFGGYAQQWVGPVPPSYPYNNNVTSDEPYYSSNLSLAQSEIADSPCAANACAGTSINYLYLDTGMDWAETAQLLEADLNAIGITINPVGVTLDQLYEEQGVDPDGQCISATTANGGPFYMGQEFYTSDYIAPDDWTQNDAQNHGSANECMAGYNNATVTDDTYVAASSDDPTTLAELYTNMTEALYQNYSEIWLVVPTSFAVYATTVHSIVLNPMGSAEPFSLFFNTQWASSPPTYSVTFTESGLPSGTTWYVNLTGGPFLNSTTGTIEFLEPNGSFDYSAASSDKTYAPTPPGGSFEVSGASVSVSATFQLVAYSVTFTEAGLAPGAEWWVDLSGQNTSSTASSLTTSLANGTYSYTASAPGYSTQLGSVSVQGPPSAPVPLAFVSSTTTSGPPILEYVAVGVVIAAVAIGVGAVFVRRRGKAPPASDAPASDSGSTPPPPAS
ncbi:MAG: ABC transporter substrate-binding protein [Thermoplasmata archaeon]